MVCWPLLLGGRLWDGRRGRTSGLQNLSYHAYTALLSSYAGCPFRLVILARTGEGERQSETGGICCSRGWRGRVAWVDTPRELVGAALKTLGFGLNASAAELAAAGVTAEDVRARVDALRRQVRRLEYNDCSASAMESVFLSD